MERIEALKAMEEAYLKAAKYWDNVVYMTDLSAKELRVCGDHLEKSFEELREAI